MLERLNHADYIATSVICEIEYLAFPELPNEDRALFDSFVKLVHVVDLRSDDAALRDQILLLRSGRKLKLPDAIIAASALCQDCILLTEDKVLLGHDKVHSLSYAL